jgi:hypothetical protein
LDLLYLNDDNHDEQVNKMEYNHNHLILHNLMNLSLLFVDNHHYEYRTDHSKKRKIIVLGFN